MYETKGIVTSVSPFSETDDQITIEMVVPESFGEEAKPVLMNGSYRKAAPMSVIPSRS